MFILLFIGISRKNSIADDVSNKEIDSSHIVMFSSLHRIIDLYIRVFIRVSAGGGGLFGVFGVKNDKNCFFRCKTL